MTLGDVRLYLLDLEEALGRHMSRGETRYAKKEVRTVIEDLAFANAHAKDRLVPSDLDYARALESLKSPDAAADVLAARRPVYKRRQLQATIRGWSVLLLIVLAAVGVANLVTSEVATPLAAESFATDEPASGTVVYERFNVTAGATRLDVDARVTGLDPEGRVVVQLLDPSGTVAWNEEFTRAGRAYARANVDPVPGQWTMLVDYHDTRGAVRVEVQAVTPG